MSIEQDNQLAAHILNKVLSCGKEMAEEVIEHLDFLGWELRQYKYHMTPERWKQMADEQANP